MQNRKFLELYNEALTKYSKRELRSGYEKGFFSSWRHSAKPYPRITALQAALKDEKKDPIQVIKQHLNDPQSTFNNHSFNMFLLDLLVKHSPEEKWEQYYPKSKKVCFYQTPVRSTGSLSKEELSMKQDNLYKHFERRGFLFRGSLQKCADGFEYGMKELESSRRVDAYAKINNLSVGVSTSKSYSQACLYAQTSRLYYTPTRAIYNASLPSYIYVINYRGIGGIDVEATLRTRQGTLSSRDILRCEKEVNVVSAIPREDIVGAWHVGRDEFIPNPHYQEKRDAEVVDNDLLRMRRLFK
jgi:hypothetical protein